MSKESKDLSKGSHIKLYECRKCNKVYKHKQTRYAHEKKCKSEKINDEIIVLKEEIQALHKIIKESLKIDKKELNKINNQLNLNQQNSNNNNNYYFQLGYENF